MSKSMAKIVSFAPWLYPAQTCRILWTFSYFNAFDINQVFSLFFGLQLSFRHFNDEKAQCPFVRLLFHTLLLRTGK